MAGFIATQSPIESFYPTPAATDPVLHDLVVNGWTEAHTFAKAAYDAAIQYLTELENATNKIGDIPPIDINLPVLNPDLTQIELDPTLKNALLSATPVTPQNVTFFSETPYASQYLNDLLSTLDTWVTGTNTGLPAAVEAAIWQRGRDRETTQFALKAKTAFKTFAMRGFPKPPGALSIEIQDAAQALQDTSSTVSRDVMVKQAELEQTNRRFAFEQAWKVQEGLINYTSQTMTRALDYVKTVQTFILGVYGEEVKKFDIEERTYSTDINAKALMYKEEVDAAVAVANLRIEESKANIMLLIQEANLLIESIKGGAMVAAQLAASALSAVSLQGSIHSGTQTNADNSVSNSVSVQSHSSVSASEQVSVSYNISGDAPDPVPSVPVFV